MYSLLNVRGAAIAAIALSTTAPSAFAQGNTFTYTCELVGVSAPEPLGDREGHAISVAEPSCRVDTGPMKGGVLTGTVIYEWNGPNAVLLAGSGVIRKPGSTVVYQLTEEKFTSTITDGKVTGFTVSGQGIIKLATGDAAGLAGKLSPYTVKSAGPGQFTVEGSYNE